MVCVLAGMEDGEFLLLGDCWLEYESLLAVGRGGEICSFWLLIMVLLLPCLAARR